ncbi:agamous-like MADS-box protein AGL29 [Aegilops tauschii subsp. strangulata]|uniref:agamous-like MADS-box protein AGL29 n=1 Tax=Aegilops tauschii subsp. strangulata TaxID=200361 RepID=UPI000989CA47|nr:agamous-like MADS-box protein AGL29 [Aegilops tauschii subsp. strangulata]
MAPKRSGSNGRKKTVLLPIVKKDSRHVCFSKRKQGLFSKASTLAVLTGAQVAAVVFSPGGKAFSFGHPSVDPILNRFMAGEGAEDQAPADDNRLQTLHRQHSEMRTELAAQKKGKKRADEALAQERAAGDKTAAWVRADVSDMGYEDMAAFAAALMQVQAAVSGRANQVLLDAFHFDISRKLQVPPPLGASRSSSANAGIEMQQVQMEMHPPQGFAAGMEMQMVMPPPQGFSGGLDREMHQQPGFTGGMEMEMLMTMVPAMPEFSAGMDLAQQGLGPNTGCPY